MTPSALAETSLLNTSGSGADRGVFGSVPVMPAAELIEEVIDVRAGGTTMAVIRKRPAMGDHPGVVMFHDGPGIRGATHTFASKLADAGYDVIIPDLYHRHGRMIGYELHERAANPALEDHLREVYQSLDDDEIQAGLEHFVRARIDATQVSPLVGRAVPPPSFRPCPRRTTSGRRPTRRARPRRCTPWIQCRCSAARR